jgi:hypothetical protein
MTNFFVLQISSDLACKNLLNTSTFVAFFHSSLETGKAKILFTAKYDMTKQKNGSDDQREIRSAFIYAGSPWTWVVISVISS